MTAQENPYVRVYYAIVDDPKFATVYDDDAALSLWLRLLLIADATYPASAPVPVCDSSALTKLAEVRLIDLIGSSRYRIHGLERERLQRSSRARSAATRRWDKDEPKDEPPAAMQEQCVSNADALPEQCVSNADAFPLECVSNADAMQPHLQVSCTPNRTEPNQAKPIRSEPSQPRAGDPLETYYQLVATWPSSKVVSWLNQLGSKYGDDAVSRMLATEWTKSNDRSTLLSRTAASLGAKTYRGSKGTKVPEPLPDISDEQRKANIERLRQTMKEAGLIE